MSLGVGVGVFGQSKKVVPRTSQAVPRGKHPATICATLNITKTHYGMQMRIFRMFFPAVAYTCYLYTYIIVYARVCIYIRSRRSSRPPVAPFGRERRQYDDIGAKHNTLCAAAAAAAIAVEWSRGKRMRDGRGGEQRRKVLGRMVHRRRRSLRRWCRRSRSNNNIIPATSHVRATSTLAPPTTRRIL